MFNKIAKHVYVCNKITQLWDIRINIFYLFYLHMRLTVDSKRFNSHKDNLDPVYSPRTTYKRIKDAEDKLLSDMTLNFDRFTISLLKAQFQKRQGKMGMIEFMKIVKQHLGAWQPDLPNRQIKIFRCLSVLFKQIDINCNGILEWDEFTNYIIEKATVLKNLKSKSDEIKAYTKSSVRLKDKIDEIIPKTVYIGQINRIAFFTEGSNIVKFINPDNREINQKNLQISPKQLTVNVSAIKKGTNGEKMLIKKKQNVLTIEIRILDILYIKDEKYQMLLTSTSDCIIRGWTYTPNGFVLANQPDNQQQFVEHQFSQQIYCLAWDSMNQLLYCGQRQGTIAVWNLKTDTERMLYAENSQGHNKIIMDMLTMPKLQFMASGAMDSKLVLWDTTNNKVKWVYKQHTRGILSLSFNESLILLFSAGFDHQICIWNPYISTIIHKIQGHLAPILSIKVVEGTHQIISLDADGMVKISDTRRFNFISSFSIDSCDQSKNNSPTSLTIIPKPLKLCFSGRGLCIFQYDKNYNPNAVDDSSAITCKYVEESMKFLTPSGNKVKSWDALTGDIDKIFLDVTAHQITAFCLDQLQRRMIIGDIKGNIGIYNCKNGAKMKVLPGHAGEITHIVSRRIEGTDMFISAGIDNLIHISRQTNENYEHIKTISIKRELAITRMIFSQEMRLILVGLNNGTIGFYDAQTGKLTVSIHQPVPEEITSLCIVSQKFLISTTNTGRIIANHMPSHSEKYKTIFTKIHMDPESRNNSLGILFADCINQWMTLLVVDQRNYLSCYSFREPKQQKSTTDPKVSRLRKRTIYSDTINNCYLQWSIKTHNQMVRSMEVVPSQRIVLTTSYDKKVIIWNAANGKQIDSLQQNYDKREPKPIAFKNKQTSELVLLQQKLVNIQLKQAQKLTDEFNPFCDLDRIDKSKLTCLQSNQEWRLQVKYKQHYQTQKRLFEEIIRKVSNHRQRPPKLLTDYTVISRNLSNDKLKLIGFMRAKQGRIDLMDDRIQNVHPQNQLKRLMSKKEIKIFGMLDLKKVKSREELKGQQEHHRAYINLLSKRDITSRNISNDAKIYLTRREAEAANKLTLALQKIDKDDRRMFNFTRSIVIKN